MGEFLAGRQGPALPKGLAVGFTICTLVDRAKRQRGGPAGLLVGE